jgi:hypothetical protein
LLVASAFRYTSREVSSALPFAHFARCHFHGTFISARDSEKVSKKKNEVKMYQMDAAAAGAGGQNRNDKSSPRLVRSGRISSATSYKEILRLIHTNRVVEMGILHIRGKSIQGDIVISGGIRIIGAATSAGRSGWSAAKELLGVNDGLFQFHDFTGVNIGSLDQALDVRIPNVIDAMPNLPDNFNDLNVRNSMHRIRAMNLDRLVEDKVAEQAVLAHVKREVQSFEERTMQFRAIILWSFFALLSLVTMCVMRLNS